MNLLSSRLVRRPPNRVLGLSLLFGASFVAAAPHASQDVNSGPIAISNPWARETAKGQPTGGGFLTLVNKSRTDDRLIGGSSSIARDVQLHTMSMAGGIMRMRPLKDGLLLPPGKSVALQPSGAHIMFIDLKRPLKRGEIIPVTLTFARAGKVAVRFKVEPVTFGGMNHD